MKGLGVERMVFFSIKQSITTVFMNGDRVPEDARPLLPKAITSDCHGNLLDGAKAGLICNFEPI